VDPENNGLTVYRFQQASILTYTYKRNAVVSVGIFSDLAIALEHIFAE
jgi:hypothetical protein